jgi:EAL domain-containing protein (putative c-di-GMP-specific phosphodiesterase class I)
MKTTTITLNEREHASVLAALRLLEPRVGSVERSSVSDIATNAGRLDPLTSHEIDELCQRLNSDDDETPVRVIVETSGGVVQAVHTSVPANCSTLDHDDLEDARSSNAEGAKEELERLEALEKEIETLEFEG